jgi:hypothetical protein
VHPVSTALFILGYGLALPIGMKLGRMVAQQHRMALLGHQVGVILALLGWLLRGDLLLAAVHGVWLVGARIWFHLGRPERQAPT